MQVITSLDELDALIKGESPADLAEALRAWLTLGDAAPKSKDIPWLNWEQSSRRLLNAVIGAHCYRHWPDNAHNQDTARATRANSRASIEAGYSREHGLKDKC